MKSQPLIKKKDQDECSNQAKGTNSCIIQKHSANCGRRPRFKNKFDEIKHRYKHVIFSKPYTDVSAYSHTEREQKGCGKCLLAQVSRGKQAPRRKMTAQPFIVAMIILAVISAISITSINCDHHQQNKLRQPKEISRYNNPPSNYQRDRVFSSTDHTHRLKTSKHRAITQQQQQRFNQKHKRQQHKRRTTRSDAWHQENVAFTAKETLKVAALARKLEQWLTCRRFLNGVAAATVASSEPQTNAGQDTNVAGTMTDDASKMEAEVAAVAAASLCGAHYDGHLCWPPTRAGHRAKLACPHLNWLPNQIAQEHSDKTVMNSMPSSAQQQTTRVFPLNQATDSLLSNNKNTSSSISIALQSASSSNATDAIIHREAAKEETRSANGTGELIQYAERSCEQLAGNNQTRAEWQLNADYSACRNINPKEGYIQEQAFDPTDEWIKLDSEADQRLFGSLVDELERMEGTVDPYSDPDFQEQWSLCIGNIMREQQQQQLRSSASGSASNANQPAAAAVSQWCPIIFDGWRCWPSTRAGETAYVSCPRNQPGFSAERKAYKICTNDGSWYRHPKTNRYWSNYTTCVDTADLEFRTKILNLYVIGNLISLVALSASLIIFISFKSLNCTRVSIHKNLFLSFITNNLMWIIWYTYVVNDAKLLQSNPIECQLWHILLHYFLVSNYFWMFCEGLYLHTLLVVAFVSEDKILKWFYLLGWLTPVPITVAYAYYRSHDLEYTNFCWMEESPHNLILMAPIGISLLLNLIFLINIVRVLVTKLRANNSPDTHQTRKAVRATLILIPLLGLHYILTPFRPEAKSEWEGIYECIAAVCTSFQGLCVALLFCFCNGEVMAVIKKKLKDTFNLSHRGGHHNDTDYCGRSRGATGSTSVGNTHNGGSQTLRSVISSSTTTTIAGSNGNLQLQRGSAPTNGHQQRSNGTASNNSNSSSLVTTVTGSPIQMPATVTVTATTITVLSKTNQLLNETSLQTPLASCELKRGPNRRSPTNPSDKTDASEDEMINLLHHEDNGNSTAVPVV